MQKIFIVGNLTSDPEIRITQSGKKVCTFGVAVNRRRSGQQEADFFRVSAWEKLGENCKAYLAKGRKVCVVGEVSVHAYVTTDGQARGSLEVMATDVEFLTPKGETSHDAQPANAVQSAPSAVPSGFVEVNDDDLPF